MMQVALSADYWSNAGILDNTAFVCYVISGTMSLKYDAMRQASLCTQKRLLKPAQRKQKLEHHSIVEPLQ